MPDWTTIAQVRKKLLARWQAGKFLREALSPAPMFPMRVSLKHPNGRSLSDDFNAAKDWVKTICTAADKNQLTLEWMEINHRQLGRNRLPVALLFESLDHLLHWLGYLKEKNCFLKLSQTLLHEFPTLRPWVLKYPQQLLDFAEKLPTLMSVLSWPQQNPNPGIYLGQLSLPDIDTKFLEVHQKILSIWFDFVLPEHEIRPAGCSFALKYGFKAKPTVVRFRMLDNDLFIQGLSDLAIPETDFCKLNPAVKTVFIVENDITALSFPPSLNTMVIFGRGYGFESLVQAEWIKDKRLFYWGDIDTHGFAILNQFRYHFPQTRSFLMDSPTLLAHQKHWTVEPKPSRADLPYLAEEELILFSKLKNNQFGNQIRLEQEYISFEILEARLRRVVY